MNRFLAALTPLFCLQFLSAQNQADTLREYVLSEVVVTATRSTLPLADSPSPVEVLRLSDADATGGSTAGSLLRRANGVFLRDLGGYGSLKTALVRGTAAQHLLVLINGNRLSSFQNGLADLGLLSLSNVDRIEIVRGGSSALYGADALGGVVNIFTRTSVEGFGARVQGEGGSYGYQRWLAEASHREGSIGVLGGVTLEEGRDDYQFRILRPGLPDTSATRSNADFRKRQIHFQGDWGPDKSSAVSLFGQFVRAESGVPGPISFPSPEARQADDIADVLLSYHTMPTTNLDLSVRGGFHYGLQRYRDPNPVFPIKSDYHNSSISINPQVVLTPQGDMKLTLGAEWSDARLRGGDFEDIVKRVSTALYLSGEYHWTQDRWWGDRLSIYGILRYDNISDVDRALTPKVGANLRILRTGDVRIRGSYGRSFRAPSFNDLYYVGFNNPLLRPERSTSADIGLTAGFDLDGPHMVEITWYALNVTDRIVFDLSIFKPNNIGRTGTKGFEVRYSAAILDDLLDFSINYSFADSRKLNKDGSNDPAYEKRLALIPTSLLNASMIIDTGPVSLSLYHSMTGRRFTTDDNSQSLPPVHTTDAGISVPVVLGMGHMRVSFSVDNVFDRNYSLMPGYPMPGRRLKAGIRLEY